MRILCLIPEMGPGGAERVMSHLVGYLTREHEVTLMTWERPGVRPFFPLPDTIRFIQADRLGGRGPSRIMKITARLATIRQAVRHLRPDLVVSFLDTMNVTALVGCLFSGPPVIVSERNDPTHHRLGRTKEWLRDLTYPLAGALVVQTPRIAACFRSLPRERVRIIGNPVLPATQAAKPGVPAGDRFLVIGVGRLVPQKGFGRLIDAFAGVAADQPDWELMIVGEGRERGALEDQIRRLGMNDRISLPGTTPDVAELHARAHLMAFPSYYEGFPNALAEAAAAGLPAIGYRGVSGVEDLIVDGTTGTLVDPAGGVDSLAEAMAELMADAPRRTGMGLAARKHVEQWRPEQIFRLWDSVIADVTRANRDRTRATNAGDAQR